MDVDPAKPWHSGVVVYRRFVSCVVESSLTANELCMQAACLTSTPYEWLRELLHCFSDGNMAQFEELCAKYGPEMNSQPALVAAERTLKQKITIMCLVALVSACAPCRSQCSDVLILFPMF
jgi:hypothetical protein